MRANQPGWREADPTDQPQPDQKRVEVRVRSYQLKEPLPSGVSHVIRFFLRLAPESPGGTFADVIMGM
jgi:hypothetical protein